MKEQNDKLQLTIEVSYPTRRMHLFKGDLTEILKAKPTTCTALVLDYVKVFEEILVNSENLPNCDNKPNEADDLKVAKLDNKTCELFENLNLKKETERIPSK